MANLLALFGMLCWGIGPVFAKLGLEGVDPLFGLWARTMAASIIISIWAGSSIHAAGFFAISLKRLGFIVIEAIFATVAGDLAYYAAIKKGACGEVSVILSAAPAVTILLSMLVLGEKPTGWSIVGVLLITLGLVLVGLQPQL